MSHFGTKLGFALTAMLASVTPTVAATSPTDDPPPSFSGGDLYLLGNVIPDDVISDAIIRVLRIDPESGSISIAKQLGGQSSTLPNVFSNLVYDEHRDRLVFDAIAADGHSALWAMDSAGTLTALGFIDSPTPVVHVATANDGRIYCLFGSTLGYLDSNNALRMVTNLQGTGVAVFPDPDAVYFDSSTNALFMAYGSRNLYYICGGVWSGEYDEIHFRKVALSTDGSRVVADTCNAFTDLPICDPSGDFCTPTAARGISKTGDGRLLLCWAGGRGEFATPRMLLIDPETLGTSVYASNGPYLVPPPGLRQQRFRMNAGCYSRILDRAVVLDSARIDQTNGAADPHLRTFFYGQSGGEGATFGGHVISAPDVAWLAEITSPLDAEPPVVQITTPVEGAVVGALNVEVRVEVQDASEVHVTSQPAGLDVTIPSGGGTESGMVALPDEGTNLILVNATDVAGNAAGATVSVVRDVTSPQVFVTIPPEGTVFSATPIQLSATIVDATATTTTYGEQSIALAPGGGSAGFEASLVEGQNVLAVVVVDAAGNLTQRDVSVVLDSTAPLVTLVRPQSGETFGLGEELVPVEVVVDDASETTVSSSPDGVSTVLPRGGGIVVGAILLEEGDNALVVTAQDETGRIGSAVASVRLDTTGPLVSIESPDGSTALRSGVDFGVQVLDPIPGSGVSVVQLRVDDDVVADFTNPPYTIPFDTTGVLDGIRTFEAVATDGKGNVGSARVDVLVDNTPPVAILEAPTVGALVRGVIDLRASVADAGSGLASVQVTVAGVEPTTDPSVEYAVPIGFDLRSGSEDTTRWADGPVEIAAVVRDAAGNESRSAIEVLVDNTAPVRAILSPLDGSVVSGVIELAGFSDAPDLAEIAFLVDGELEATSTTSPLVTTLDTTERIDGPMSVVLRTTDTAGNTSTSSVLVTVRNMTLRISPATLNLKAKVQDKTTTVEIRGSQIALLLPPTAADYELHVPGGAPVVGTTLRTSGEGDAVKVEFDRGALVDAVRTGIAAGLILPDASFTVTLHVAGAVFGADSMRIVGK